jgi:N-acetylmuramoyl-L-alanine amidase
MCLSLIVPILKTQTVGRRYSGFPKGKDNVNWHGRNRSGHGGTARIGDSDGNHAVSVSGVKEKDLTMILANLVKSELQTAAAAGGHSINIVMTRTGDVNLGLGDRARVARANHADRFLSIHLNASDNGPARGTETYVRRAKDNVNLSADKRFAAKVQTAVFNAIRSFDPNTRDRGVKEHSLAYSTTLPWGIPQADIAEQSFRKLSSSITRALIFC